VPVLTAADVVTLQAGVTDADGNAALIAPGTGLGEAMLARVRGRLEPSPSEGGHADFAARTPREVELLEWITARYGRADCERVISGPGLVNIHRLTHRTPCAAADPDDPRAAALISEAAIGHRCPSCVEALSLFVGALGAEAGNLALRAVATAGVYLGGGIPPKILPALRSEGFLDAFRAKAPLGALVAAVPVHVITCADPGLLGAAVAAGATRDKSAA
jgi:glucokinase